ncbi:MAG: aldehyde dehydrogenase family protein [Bilophila wadsworthia]
MVAYSASACSSCLACSRVIVLDAIYDTFVQRLALAAQSLRIGPAETPENSGPVADASLQKNVSEYIKIAEAEEDARQGSDLPDKAYVPLLIVEDVMPEHRIAQESLRRCSP